MQRLLFLSLKKLSSEVSTSEKFAWFWRFIWITKLFSGETTVYILLTIKC